MIFTRDQIEDILKIIDSNIIQYSVGILGTDILSQNDKKILKEFGVDIDKLKVDFSTYDKMYHWGRLSQILGELNASRVEYSDFIKYLKKGQYLPLTKVGEQMLDVSKQRTYSHIKDIGGDFKKDVINSINNAEIENRVQYENIIKEGISRGVQDRKSLQQIVGDLGNKTHDWNRNWGRLVDTEYNNIFQEGRARIIQDKYGEDAKVYKDVYSGVCRFCLKAYTTKGYGSVPRIFKLKDLIANGTNIGEKASEWEPVLGGMHPYCFDKDTEVLTDEGWKYWPDVTGNELFLSACPENKKIEWVKANRLIKYKYNGDMSYFKGRSFDLMTTPNHKHFIKSDINKKGEDRYKFSLKEEKEFQKHDAFVNIITDGWEGFSPKTIKISKNLILSFKDYCRLMGWWLSDGSISKPKGRQWQLKITQEKKYNHHEINSILEKCFSKVWHGEGAFYVPLDELTADYFLQFGHAFEKFIPEEIRSAKIEDINLFLNAFEKGDGSRRKRDNGFINSKVEIYYSTSSPKLASNLGELIIKTEYRPSYFYIKPKPIKFKNGTYTAKNTQINIYKTRSKSSYLSKIDKIRVPYNDFVYDVELEKYHTLYVKRNGKVTVSGNCRCTLYYLQPGLEWDEEKKKFLFPEVKESKFKDIKAKIKITVGDKIFYV